MYVYVLSVWIHIQYIYNTFHSLIFYTYTIYDYQDGRTPLHYACSCGHREIARILLDKGANLEATADVSISLLFRGGDHQIHMMTHKCIPYLFIC